jgi:hypothetical protein
MRPQTSPIWEPTSVEPVNEMTGSRVLDHGVADLRAEAVHELDHVRRQAGLEQHLDEERDGVRHVLGRLEDDAVAADERGNIFQVGMASGKLNGVMRPATPMGRRYVMAHLSRSSLGTVWPKRRRPSTAA